MRLWASQKSKKTVPPPHGQRGAWLLQLTLVGVTITLMLMIVSCDRGPGEPDENRVSVVGPKSSKSLSTSRGKILVVQSYHTGYPWTDAVTQGIRRALAGCEVDLEVFYMDTKRQTDQEWKIEAGQHAGRIVEQWNPDVVISVDDNAQEYFAKRYVGKENPKIVFCGVNCDAAKYGYPASNVTGILERPHFPKVVEWAQKLIPGLTRVAAISDNSPTSLGALRFLEEPESGWTLVSRDTPDSFAEWKSAVERAQTAADALLVYTYHTVRKTDGSGGVDPKEVMSWTVSNSHIPVVGCLEFAVDDGALVAYAESGVEHGLTAGIMSRKVLDGTSPGDLPVVTAERGHSVLNLATARTMGIEVSAELRAQFDLVVED